MQLNDVFTRQEAISLTGVTSEKLSYADKVGAIVPIKIGGKLHPSCFYSVNEIIRISTLKVLSDRFTTQVAQKVIEYSAIEGVTASLFCMRLIVVGGIVCNADDPKLVWWAIDKQTPISGGKHLCVRRLGAIGVEPLQLILTNQTKIDDGMKRLKAVQLIIDQLDFANAA